MILRKINISHRDRRIGFYVGCVLQQNELKEFRMGPHAEQEMLALPSEHMISHFLLQISPVCSRFCIDHGLRVCHCDISLDLFPWFCSPVWVTVFRRIYRLLTLAGRKSRPWGSRKIVWLLSVNLADTGFVLISFVSGAYESNGLSFINQSSNQPFVKHIIDDSTDIHYRKHVCLEWARSDNMYLRKGCYNIFTPDTEHWLSIIPNVGSLMWQVD